MDARQKQSHFGILAGLSFIGAALSASIPLESAASLVPTSPPPSESGMEEGRQRGEPKTGEANSQLEQREEDVTPSERSELFERISERTAEFDRTQAAPDRQEREQELEQVNEARENADSERPKLDRKPAVDPDTTN
jgi:hypothetical protein